MNLASQKAHVEKGGAVLPASHQPPQPPLGKNIPSKSTFNTANPLLSSTTSASVHERKASHWHEIPYSVSPSLHDPAIGIQLSSMIILYKTQPQFS
jgi:hypothetical protein